MLMRALAAWYNPEHEGRVEAGHEFEATHYRAADLRRNGLALPALSETRKVVVRADPPSGGIVSGPIAPILSTERTVSRKRTSARS
jgi:hypothetical protein